MMGEVGHDGRSGAMMGEGQKPRTVGGLQKPEEERMEPPLEAAEAIGP